MTRTDKAGSQQWTAVSLLLELVSRDCVAKICNASQRANAHKMTRSLYQFPYFELAYAPKHALPQHVFPSARRPKCRSYVESVCRMRSLAVKYLFMNFWSVGLFRSVTLRFYAWYWPCGWMFKCLAWPCPATFIFLLFETPIVTLWYSCAPKQVLWQRVFRSASEFKVRNLT